MPIFTNPELILEHTSLVDDFLELVRLDTQSDPKSLTRPSSARQLPALKVVQEKLLGLGLTDAAIDENGFLIASLPGNVPGAPAIGLLAHIDTAVDFPAENVKPVVHANYAGGPLLQPSGSRITPEDSPELAECLGDTIITSDGTTLLGADDKAGVAEILAVLKVLTDHPDLPRPTVKVAITPDEEIGRGTVGFDVAGFGALCAYTLDGGFTGEVNGENFNADGALVTINGVSVHPGHAKGKMINALRWAAKFLERLPAAEAPETTHEREGFFHPTGLTGNAAGAEIQMILRDFDLDGLKKRGEFLHLVARELRAQEPRLGVEVEISQTYRNMAEGLKRDPRVSDYLVQAVTEAGLKPRLNPIRGGTDGAELTAHGLPTPNLFAGGMNVHGPMEWVSTRVMAQAVCVVLNLLRKWAGA